MSEVWSSGRILLLIVVNWVNIIGITDFDFDFDFICNNLWNRCSYSWTSNIIIFFFPVDEVQVEQDSKRIKTCWRIQSHKNSISCCTNTPKVPLRLSIFTRRNNIAMANCHKKVTINSHFALKAHLHPRILAVVCFCFESLYCLNVWSDWLNALKQFEKAAISSCTRQLVTTIFFYKYTPNKYKITQENYRMSNRERIYTGGLKYTCRIRL